MGESLTVAGLVSDPSLSTDVLSGAGGTDRPVFWAHSCEMDEPWRWLQPHELLMTVGHCVPSGSEAQRGFIAALDEAGLAGITIGRDGIAPHLTKALFEESDSRNFPVLRTNHRIPFAAIARLVASSNSDQQTMEVLRLAKLYSVSAQRSMDERRSGKPLSDLFSTSIAVVDDATGCVVIGTDIVVSEEGRRYPLRNTVRPSHLVLPAESALDRFSLGHLSHVLEVDVNDVLQTALERMAAGARYFTRALSNRVEADRELSRLWDSQGSAYRVVATESEKEQRIPLMMALNEANAITKRIDHHQFVAAPVEELQTLRRMCGILGLRCGVSAVHHDPGDLGGAVEEAVSEYELAQRKNQKWREYRGESVSLLARSKSERRQIVDTVLGELAGSDPAMVPLRETLFAFLDNDRRWKATSAALHMHRQSVVYRLRRVQEITGRDIHKTKDLTELWLARASWEHYQAELGARGD